MTEPQNKQTRRAFETSSPFDKQALDVRAQKAYERKIMNVGLVIIMLVIAGMGIAAHKIFTSLSSGAENLSQNFDIGKVLPETPFSPIPAPAPVMPAEKRAPTSIDLPDAPVPHGDPSTRRVMGSIITQYSSRGGMILVVQFFAPEETRNCMLSAHVNSQAALADKTVLVEYNADSADICASAHLPNHPQ